MHLQISYVTLDNVSNNIVMLQKLKDILGSNKFSEVDNHIQQSLSISSSNSLLLMGAHAVALVDKANSVQLSLNYLKGNEYLTKIATEGLITCSKHTKTDLRNRMSPELMEACQVLKYGFKHKELLDFTGYLKDKALMEELEMVAESKNLLYPEDVPVQEYIRTFQPLPPRPQNPPDDSEDGGECKGKDRNTSK
ncbi:hypothetical protein PQX77_019091 [Marasmius sp. AFHP31]|nr:hypothetical protein PQX77_019091 [Marasmius sp. AFHP31]